VESQHERKGKGKVNKGEGLVGEQSTEECHGRGLWESGR